MAETSTATDWLARLHDIRPVMRRLAVTRWEDWTDKDHYYAQAAMLCVSGFLTLDALDGQAPGGSGKDGEG